LKLYLMRHAQPVDGMRMDPTRPLTDTGKDQARMMAKWLNKQLPASDLLLQSNFKRSQSTAKRIGKKLDLDPVTVGSLDPDGTPEQAWEDIQRLGAGKESVIAVTHAPLVQKLTAYLTGSDTPGSIHFPHAAVAHMEPTPPRAKVTEAQLQKRSKRLREGADEGATEKSWVGGTCEVCQENADAGWIDMDEQFPSGDDEPPAHPNCGCELETRDIQESAQTSKLNNKLEYISFEEGARSGKAYLRAMREIGDPANRYPVKSMNPKRVMVLHSLVTPNVVARDEDDLKLVTDDSHAVVEAALQIVEAFITEDDSETVQI
jgi:phosphohistidine phosphatase SixA